MPIEDYNNIEFGICTNYGEPNIVRIPIDNSVKQFLYEMHEEFNKTYIGINGNPELYQASEKYSTTEKLYIPLNNEYLTSLRDLFFLDSIPITNVEISEIASSIVYYFAIFRNNNGLKKIAFKRPSTFKGLLKKKLIHFIDDTLKVVNEKVFNLDNDFDFIIHNDNINILHPVGFNFIAKIEYEILRSAAETTMQLAVRLTFVNFAYISDFVRNSKTAAKLISSIKSRDDLENISQEKLIEKCNRVGVQFQENNGLITPDQGQILRFLEILDRRGYDFDILNDNIIEIYVATSRKRLGPF